MAGTKGKGIKIGVDAIGESPTYVYFAQVRTISGPNMSADDIDMTYSESTAKEFEPGFIDGGTVDVGLLYIKAQSTIVAGLVGVSKLYKIIFPDTSSWTFQGYVNSLSGEADYTAEITQSVTIKISGLPVFTAASE